MLTTSLAVFVLTTVGKYLAGFLILNQKRKKHFKYLSHLLPAHDPERKLKIFSTAMSLFLFKLTLSGTFNMNHLLQTLWSSLISASSFVLPWKLLLEAVTAAMVL